MKEILYLTVFLLFASHYLMEGDTKQQYRSPETTVFKLEVEHAILIGSGGSDPLIPEDI